jgi:galactosamine-6-phosphate isomerase
LDLSGPIVVVPDLETMSQRATGLILEAIRGTPSLLICAATGATPTRTYEILAEISAKSAALFTQVRLIKLDEWLGLKADDPATCEAYLQQHVVQPLQISADRYIAFKSDPINPQAECERIASELERQGPIDLAIVGIGKNGHIGFNEPHGAFVAHAHVSELALESRQHSMLNRSRIDNPLENIRFGLTLGIGDLLQARQLIILANGPRKRPPLQRMLKPASTEPASPASYLWQHHANAVCICDQAAMPD